MSALTAQTYALAASWVNMLFYGTEVVLAGFYFAKSHPSGFSTWTLLTALAIDTACTSIVCYYVYCSVLVNPELLISPDEPWMLPGVILCTYHVAMVEQVFFTHRYWKITRKRNLTYVASFLIFSHTAFAWCLGIDLIVIPRVTTLGLNFTTVAATLCAATDLFIAVIMFRAMRSIQSAYSSIQSLVHRVSIQSVACGMTTSISTIIMLSLLVTDHLNSFTIVFFSLGRLYTLTILVNYLILRKPIASVNMTSGLEPSSTRPSVMFRDMRTTQMFTIPMELSTITESHLEQTSGPVHSKAERIREDQEESAGSSTRKAFIVDESRTQTRPRISIDTFREHVSR